MSEHHSLENKKTSSLSLIYPTNFLKLSPQEKFMAILCWSVFIQCLGIGIAGFQYGTSFGKTLWLNLGWHDLNAYFMDKVLAVVTIFCGTLQLVLPRASAFLFCGFWMFTVSILTVVQGGSFGAPFSIPAHAVRYVVPLVLGFWLVGKALRNRSNQTSNDSAVPSWVSILIVVACSATFVAHGLEAYKGHPIFTDYIITIPDRYLGISISESTAVFLLKAIGILDIVVAIILLIRPVPIVVLHMAFWGFLTASVRFLYSPQYGLDAMLVRSLNGGAPLALFFLWQYVPTGKKWWSGLLSIRNFVNRSPSHS